ncbi:hypothetical protein Tco_1256571 [Tanacetum coccineum]
MIVNMMMGGKHSNDDVEEFARVNASNITVRVEGDPDAAKRYKRIYKCKEKGCDKEYDIVGRDINKAMVLRRPVDSKSSSSSDVSNLLSSKKALEFNLNMMPQEKQEE